MRIPFTALTVAAAALAAVSVPASVRAAAVCVVPNDKIPTSRPPEADRLFRSKVLERRIAQTAARISDPELRRMFQQCLPNTLDTTVHPGRTADGDDDTFVVTGDIDAMWLRDSGAQVWPYLRFAKDDPELRRLIRGVIRRQFQPTDGRLVRNPYNRHFPFSQILQIRAVQNLNLRPCRQCRKEHQKTKQIQSCLHTFYRFYS